jgi:replication-associated recombination protein RarA
MTNVNRYDLYELLSSLQKDIRRGNEYEAVFWAIQLESFNPTALWNRLKVIASEDIDCANTIMPILIETLEKHYLASKQKLNDESYRLFFVNAVICLCRSQKSRITDDLLNLVYSEIEHENKYLPIPDYALDMHTSRGKIKGRGIDHFFDEGAKLENEAFPNPYTKRAKELLSKYGR